MAKVIKLNKKEEEWIRLQIAVFLESYSCPHVPGFQDDLWNNKKFLFDKKRFEPNEHAEFEICKVIFKELEKSEGEI